jgi:hypothetical protein
MGTSSSESVRPFDVSGDMSPPGEPGSDGTRVRVATQVREQPERPTLPVADFCLTEAKAEHLAGGVGKEQLQAAANSQTETPEDDTLARLQKSIRSLQDAPEVRRLPRCAQLPPVPGLPSVDAATRASNSRSFELEARTPPRLVLRRRDALSTRVKFLSAGAIAGLLAGYFVFGSSDRAVEVAVTPQPTIDIPSLASLPSWHVEAPSAEARDITVERRVEVEAQTASVQPPARLDIQLTESETEARPPPPLPEKGGQLFAAKRQDPTCFPSASAVREKHPGGWPSWTMRAPGHEGTKCWYAAARTTAHDHRSAIMPGKETIGTTEKLGSPGVGERVTDQGNADVQNSRAVPAPLGQPNVAAPAPTVASSGTQDGEAATKAARLGVADRASERGLNLAQETALNEVVLQARACIRENLRAAYQSSEGVEQATSFLMRRCLGPFSSAIASGEASATMRFKGIVFQELSPDEWLRALEERAVGRGR